MVFILQNHANSDFKLKYHLTNLLRQFTRTVDQLQSND